jgi:hypothetical protein
VRLKRDIEPLEMALARASGSEEALDTDKSISWVLRELRPVAYRFKRGAEAKYMRLGFVAQEVESVLPMLTRPIAKSKDDEEDIKGVIMTDLIAVLVAHARSSQEKLEAQATELGALRERVAALETQVARVHDFESRIAALEFTRAQSRPSQIV